MVSSQSLQSLQIRNMLEAQACLFHHQCRTPGHAFQGHTRQVRNAAFGKGIYGRPGAEAGVLACKSSHSYNNSGLSMFFSSYMGLSPLPQPKVAAGTDFVRKSMEAFRPATVKATVLVDVLSYDASPALAVLEDAWINLGRACLYNPGLWVHKNSWGILAISTSF